MYVLYQTKEMADPSTIRVFASHDWGKDGITHARVASVVACLRKKGIHVWFDETHMKGNILDSMCNGIENSDVILVFVTNNYMQKVSGGAGADNVRREFMFASATPQKLLPIRFELDLPRIWTGPLRMELGNTLYVDMSSDETSDVKVNALVESIQRWTTMTMNKSACNVLKKMPASPPPGVFKDVRKAPVRTRTPSSIRDRVGHILKVMGDDRASGEHIGTTVNRLALTIIGDTGITQKAALYEKIGLIEDHLGIAR